MDYRDIIITNIDENGRLKIQEIGKGTASLETLMSEFRKFHLDGKNKTGLKGMQDGIWRVSCGVSAVKIVGHPLEEL